MSTPDLSTLRIDVRARLGGHRRRQRVGLPSAATSRRTAWRRGSRWSSAGTRDTWPTDEASAYAGGATRRWLAHRLRNLRSKAPESQWPEIALRARAGYEAASPALATLLRDDFVQAYGHELPAVVQCFVDDFDACIAHLRFPLRHRKVIRTTNLLERLFLEERRRTKIIPNAFGERPVLKLMYAAMIRAADRWRGITVGEFEQRQLRAIREELRAAVIVALNTGLRLGELIGLTWERVDLSRGVIRLELTKSGRRREVPMNDASYRALVGLGPKGSGRVFKTRYIKTAYNNAVETAQLDDVTFHTLRHTFASWAIMRGVTLKELQELLGHSSLAMTMRYAHLAPEHLRTAVSRLEGLTSTEPTKV